MVQLDLLIEVFKYLAVMKDGIVELLVVGEDDVLHGASVDESSVSICSFQFGSNHGWAH